MICYPLKRLHVILFVVALCGGAHAQTGGGLAVSDGEFTFTDLARGRIARLDREGRLRVLVNDVHCHNIALGYDGYIYGEAVGTNGGGTGDALGIWRLSPDGGREWVMPPTASPLEGVWIARDAAGNSYGWHADSTGGRIVRRSPDGSAQVFYGCSGELSSVGGLAITPRGVVYTTDAGDLRRMHPDGTIETLANGVVSTRTGGIPGRSDLFNHSVGVAVAMMGGRETMLVVDHYNQRVLAWSESQGAHVLWNTSNWLTRVTNGGLGWQVTGVAVDSDTVYVLEAFQAPALIADLVGSPRIRRLEPGGTSTIVASVASLKVRVTAILLAGGMILVVVFFSRRLRRRRRKSASVVAK